MPVFLPTSFFFPSFRSAIVMGSELKYLISLFSLPPKKNTALRHAKDLTGEDNLLYHNMTEITKTLGIGMNNLKTWYKAMREWFTANPSCNVKGVSRNKNCEKLWPLYNHFYVKFKDTVDVANDTTQNAYAKTIQKCVKKNLSNKRQSHTFKLVSSSSNAEPCTPHASGGLQLLKEETPLLYANLSNKRRSHTSKPGGSSSEAESCISLPVKACHRGKETFCFMPIFTSSMTRDLCAICLI